MSRSIAVVCLALELGCVGAHGTRGRAFAIDGSFAVGGGALLAVGLAQHDGFGDGFAEAVFGLTFAVLGVGGALLTGIGMIGERTRAGESALVAVRPWTPTAGRAPFDATGVVGPAAEVVARALTAARAHDCAAALEAADRVWSIALPTHAALVRDPAIAACITTGGAP